MIAAAFLLASLAPPQESRPASRPAAPDPPALVLELSSPDPDAREAAADALRKIGRPAVPAVRGALHAADAGARRLAVLLLGEFEAKEAAPHLERAVRSDPCEQVRAEAVCSLAKIRPEGCSEIFAEVLRDELAPRVLRAVLVTIRELRDPGAVEAVLSFAEGTQDRYLQAAAARTLGNLTGQRCGPDFAAWRAWWTEYGPKFLEMQKRTAADAPQSRPASPP